jgi:hypothetical protein
MSRPRQSFYYTVALIGALAGTSARRAIWRADKMSRPRQSFYYTVALIGALAGGILNVVLGLIAMIGS